MPLRYTRTTDGCLQLDVNDDSSGSEFERVAGQIVKRLGGRIVARSDDPDQRRWDMDIDGAVVSLHLEQRRSLRLFAADPGGDDAVRRVGQFLATIMRMK
jgi:hypothetical protein